MLRREVGAGGRGVPSHQIDIPYRIMSVPLNSDKSLFLQNYNYRGFCFTCLRWMNWGGGDTIERRGTHDAMVDVSSKTDVLLYAGRSVIDLLSSLLSVSVCLLFCVPCSMYLCAQGVLCMQIIRR